MRMTALRNICLFAGLAVLGACGDGDAPAPSGLARIPASVAATVSIASLAAGTTVSPVPTFVVKDETGAAIAGVPVSIAVTAGGGTLVGAPTQTSDGPISVGTWTLGTTVGTNTLTISAQGLPAETVTINSVAGPPASLAVSSGSGQTALGGRALLQPVRFIVRDQHNNPVPGQTLSFSLVGGGTLSGTAAPSGSDGIVTAPSWTLGKSVVPQQLIATLGTLPSAATATVQSAYHITVRFYGASMTAEQQAYFTTAAARISAMVTGDLPDVNVNGLNAADYCGDPDLPTLSGTADDVIIFAAIKPMDGPGKVLAQAGPCAVRDDALSHPVLGIMMFDEADVASLSARGSMPLVIMHEMMHVLGLGTFWQYDSLLTGAGTSNVAYFGALGVENCRAVGGTSICASSVPVENTGGEGTADSHWRESTFGSELMTGYLNSGSNPISRMTIGGFADLGYVVNYHAADVYRIPGTSASFDGTSLRIEASQVLTAPGWEKPKRVGARITPSGRVTPVFPTQ